MSNMQLAYLIIITQISKMVSDIPIGMIGEKIGQKWLFTIASSCRIAFCLVLLNGSSFNIFAIGAAVYGIAMSCIFSHTESYYCVALSSQGKENYLPKFIGKYYSLQNIAITIATLASGVLYDIFNVEGVLYISIVMLSVAVLISVFFINDSNSAKKEGISLNIFKVLKYVLSKPRLVRIAVLSSFLDALFITFLELNTIIMAKHGASGKLIANIVGITGAVRIFTNYFSGYASKFMSFKKMNTYLLIFSIIAMFACLKERLFVSAAIVLFLCIYPFFDTSAKSKIQFKIKDGNRSIISSFCTMLTSFIVIAFNVMIGKVAEKTSYRASFFALMLVVIIVTSSLRNILGFYKIKRKKVTF